MQYTEVRSPTDKQLKKIQELLEDPKPRNRKERRAQAKRNKKKRS